MFALYIFFFWPFNDDYSTLYPAHSDAQVAIAEYAYLKSDSK